MSTGSYLYLLRKHKSEKMTDSTKREEVLKTLYLNPDESKVEQESHIDNILKQKFTDLPLMRMVDNSDNTVCDVCLKTRFASTFSELPDYYNLSQYEMKNNQVVISYDEAKWMIQALDFLIFGNRMNWYDPITEKVLNNQWIKIFGQSLPSYFYYRNHENEKIAVEDEEEEEFGLRDLNQFKTLLESYVNSHEDSWSDDGEYEYVALYEKW